MLNYGKQDIDISDIEAVCEVLKSDLLTQGPMVPLFEEKIQNYCTVHHALAVNSATSALHIALKALEVTDGDYVWTSPNSFVASANCALYCGAKIDFVDIDASTYNMSVKSLEEKLVAAAKLGTLPKVLIPVHFAGQACDMKVIHKLSCEYGFKVIEDASHAIGANYPSSKVGSCEFSDITVFSFHPVKIITTGEGGMAVTKCEELYQKMNLLRSHGVTRDPKLLTQDLHGPWYYEQIALGFNYRMTDIQAALGVSQFKRLDDFVSKRNMIAATYDAALKDLPLQLPNVVDRYQSAYHLYVIRLQLAELAPLTHLKIFERLRQNGIGVNLHYIPIHTQPYFQNFGFKWGDFPNAECYYREAISIPIFPSMKPTEQAQVIDVLSRVLN